MRITLSFVSWKRDTKTTILSLWARISLNHDPSIVRDEAHDFEPLDTKLKLSSSLLLFRRFLLSINTEPKKTTKTKSLVEIREEIKKKKASFDRSSKWRGERGVVVERRAEATVGSRGEGNGSIFVVLSKKKRNDFVCGWRGDSKYWSFLLFVWFLLLLFWCSVSLSLFLCFFLNLILKMFFLKFNPN